MVKAGVFLLARLYPALAGTEQWFYMVSFTGGSRQCLGINLAHAEMYLGLAAIWRMWGSRECRGEDDVGVFELFETGLRDVEIESDAFLPIQQPGTKGIRVKAFM